MISKHAYQHVFGYVVRSFNIVTEKYLCSVYYYFEIIPEIKIKLKNNRREYVFPTKYKYENIFVSRAFK